MRKGEQLDWLSAYLEHTEQAKKLRLQLENQESLRRIYLRKFREDGMSYREICELTGVPFGSLFKMLKKADLEHHEMFGWYDELPQQGRDGSESSGVADVS